MQLSPTPVSPAPPLTAEFARQPAKAGGAGLARMLQRHRLGVAAGFVILIAGLALRLLPFCGPADQLSFDEYLYITNVLKVERIGPYEYPVLVQDYVEQQSQQSDVMLPPTRCVYILMGWAWDAVFHSGAQMSLRAVAAIFSILAFLLSGLFAYRLGGTRMALVVGALMAVGPMELTLAHRELVDGVFAFWALLSLWLLWENLQKPGRMGWLAAYAASITAMVLTKENAFFAVVGLVGIICTAAVAPGLKLGKPAWSTVAATVAGGVIGILVLVSLAGSPQRLIEVYRLLVIKAEKMDFAYRSGGGPWFRYIVDIMLVSPAVLLPAIGGIFGLKRENRQGIFLLLFVLFSCAIMVNVRNGMNLRYATMWDMPLRFLAAGMILQMAGAVRRAPVLAAVAIVGLVAGVELHQYWQIFIRHDIGDPITQYLMNANEIIRYGPAR